LPETLYIIGGGSGRSQVQKGFNLAASVSFPAEEVIKN